MVVVVVVVLVAPPVEVPVPAVPVCAKAAPVIIAKRATVESEVLLISVSLFHPLPHETGTVARRDRFRWPKLIGHAGAVEPVQPKFREKVW